MEQNKKDRMLSKLEVIEKGYLELQAKCDRYEKALKAIGNGCATPQRRANEALNGEGEIIRVNDNSDAFRNWVGNIKGYEIKLMEHQTGVRLPNGVTLEMFKKEWDEYESANNPSYQKCQRCNNAKATTTYSDLKVCAYCDRKLNDEFDEEYR